MADILKETVITQNEGPKAAVTTESKSVATGTQQAEYVIYFILGLVEVLLAFRLVLKLMGASVASGFVRLVYSLTGGFIVPFEGIFRRGFNQGLEATSVLEPSALVAMIVYAVLAWGIVKLTRIFSGEKQMS